MMGPMQAGWYPDPTYPNDTLRWWDGSQWTEHQHPMRPDDIQQLVQQQPPESPTEQKRRRRLWPWIAAAGTVAFALVAGLVVVPQLGGVFAQGTGDADLLKRIDELPVAHTDESLGLDFTEPVLDVGNLNAPVEFKLEVDIKDGDEQLGSLTSHKWAFRLYSDASLKSEITSSAIQVDDRVSVSVYESDEATWFGAGEDPQHTEIKTGGNDWGLHANYYLVRYVDVQGEELERPVVTRFNFASDVEAPSVTAGEDPERPGDLSLTWAPVEGAERYIVVYGRSPGAETGDFEDPEMTLGLHYFHVGDTQDTTWRVSESLSSEHGGFEGERNLGIERLSMDADDAVYTGDTDFQPADLSGDELGVVAVMADGTRSPLGAVNAENTVGHLPASLATETLELAFEERQIEAADGEIPAPLFIPYVDFTGQIQYSPVTLQDASVAGEQFQAVLTSENGFEVPVRDEVQGITQQNLDETVDAFNRAATDYAGNPGALQVLGEAVLEFGTPQSEYEETGLPAPTAASHPMVDYLAQHLLAGTRTIDLTEWVNEPGAPDARAAITEAITQTPLALAHSASTNHDGTVVEVTYQLSSEDRERQQQETLAAAEDALASMNLEGKSDAQKVTAFNDYLSATVTYDYEAYEESSDWIDEYRYAYNVVGALDRGLAVCAGYSEVMNLFAQLEGIPSVYVAGKVEAGGLHAWNKFQIDGQWLSVDATWNDGDVPNHEYLLISDDAFTDHAERYQIDDQWVIPTYADLYATP